MAMLNRKLIRDLKHMRGQVFALTLVVACGIATYVTMQSAYVSLSEAQLDYYSAFRLADIFAHAKRAPESIVPSIAAIPGVDRIQTRIVMDVSLDIPGLDESATGRLVSVPPRQRPLLNDLDRREGRYIEPGRREEVLISEAFAAANGLGIGDTLSAVINGKWERLHIVGIALSPEYVYGVRPGEVFPDNRRFGILWIQTPTEFGKALALTLAAVASREESGDPLDQAILKAAKTQETDEIPFTRLATFPFTENRKRETCIARSPEGAVLAACKGAAEVVFGMCELTETERALWESEVNRYAQEGHKVIAVASNVCGAEDLSQETVRGYESVALLAFEDTVREGVPQAVKACQDAGIHTIMVTGDHLITARAVANEIGLGDGSPCIIAGDEIQELIRSNNTAAIRKIDVVARATPDQNFFWFEL